MKLQDVLDIFLKNKPKKVVRSFPIRSEWKKKHDELEKLTDEIIRLKDRHKELYKNMWSQIRLDAGEESAAQLQWNEKKNCIDVLEDEDGVPSPFVTK